MRLTSANSRPPARPAAAPSADPAGTAADHRFAAVVGSVTRAQTAAERPPIARSDSADPHPDFTRMTRRGLFDWMNARIRDGSLSLDDSAGLLSMTAGPGAVDPHDGLVDIRTDHLDDVQPVDFTALAEAGLRAGLERHDVDTITIFRRALDVMARASRPGTPRA